MRLIDADRLLEPKRVETYYHLKNGDIAIPIIDIKHAPTIEERKKGKWIPKFDGKFTGGAYWFSCSKCKRIVPDVRNGGWNYCPNCGADMRGLRDE